MNTLYTRLAAAMLGIVVALGIAFFFIARLAADTYYQEVTQRLNADIAAHIAAETPLIDNGQIAGEALKSIAHLAMLINPSTEVYLLDAQGRIIGHAASPGQVTRDRVDLGPVRAFLAPDTRMPLAGDDPRDRADRRKIFSAAPVLAGDAIVGYVYIILGGEKYDALAARIADSYTLKLSIGAIAASILLAILLALIGFNLLTRRLRRLTDHLRGFSDSDLHAGTRLPVPQHRRDEIDELAATFNAMSAQIADQVTRLEETDRLRRELITNVSHDLRTPLASMQGYIETLLIKNGDFSSAQRQRYLEIAHQHGERLGRLVDDLFELAKLDSGNVQPSAEEFSLSELLHDIGQEFGLKASGRGVELAIEEPARDRRVRADIGLIQRVLENLLENAIRHTPRGGSVRVAMIERGANVGVTVADTGCGIEASAIPRIFDRFYASEGAGTGLGLAIVKKIVDLHDGEIRVESTPGQGARFTFDLPAESVAA